jgi:MFS family permease
VNEKEVNILQRRTVKVLTAGQILGGFALGSTLSIGSLLAAALSGSPAWAGSAATFSTLGAAAWAIPMARLANARGRKVSLAAGAGLAIFGAILVITSASIGFQCCFWLCSCLVADQPRVCRPDSQPWI